MAKKVKVAFIGCGGRNGAHVQKCMEINDIGKEKYGLDFEVEYVGFCDPVEEKAVGYANRVGVSPEGKIFKDSKALLAKAPLAPLRRRGRLCVFRPFLLCLRL